jgi:hypothetical protein
MYDYYEEEFSQHKERYDELSKSMEEATQMRVM